MFARLALSFLLLVSLCTIGLAAEPFDAAAAVKAWREPLKLELATRELEKPPLPAPLAEMQFSKDGKTFGGVQTNGHIPFWEVETGKLKSFKRIETAKIIAQVGVETDVTGHRIALSQDGTRLALSLRGGEVVFWDVERELVISQLDDKLKSKWSSMELTAAGRYALLGGEKERGAIVVDTDSGKKVRTLKHQTADITHVAVSPDDKWATFADKEGSVFLFPLLGGREGQMTNFTNPPRIGHFKATNEGPIYITNRNELNRVYWGKTTKSSMRASLPSRIVVSPDGRYGAIYDTSGMLEIRDLESTELSWHQNFADDKPISYAIAGDGRTLGANYKEGPKLKVFSALPEHPSTRMRRELRALIAAEKFDDIQAIAEQLTKEQDAPFAWDPLNAPIDALLDAAAQHKLQAPLDKWVAAEKDAVLPKLLLASSCIGDALSLREGPDSKVADADWDRYQKNIDRANELLVPLCDKADSPATARMLLLSLAMLEGRRPDQWMKHAEWLLENAPRYTRGQRQVVQMLLPRWGGLAGDSERFAGRLADTLGGGDGDAMYAKVWLANFDLHGRTTLVADELAMDFERIKKGLTILAEKSANPNYFGHRGLQACYMRKDKEAAKAFLDKLKDPMDNWEITWWHHPHELAAAIRFASDGATP